MKPAEGTTPAVQQTQQPRPCPQDCRKCGMNQQLYCSTQMLFNLSRAIQETRQQLSEVELAVADLKDQIQPKIAGDQFSSPFPK